MGNRFTKKLVGNTNFGTHDYHNLLNNIDEVDKVKLHTFVKENCNHGAEPTDDQLENMLKALHKSDEKAFIETMINMTSISAREPDDANSSILPEAKDFYAINAYHARHDKFAGKMYAPLKGKTVNSAFCGTILVRRYTDVLDTLPDHVAVRSKKEVELWAKTIKIECSHPNGVEPYFIDRPNVPKAGCMSFMEDKYYRASFVKIVEKIDWKEAEFEVYATVPFDEEKSGPVFAPAFNSLWMIRGKDEGETVPNLKLWFIHAALADGTPASGYFGLEFDVPILARAGSKFSPVADEKNIYQVTLKNDPLTIKIESFHHKHDPKLSYPYIIVTCIFKPATMKEITEVVGEIGVDDLWDEAIRKTTAMIVKGALVEEILVSYYPTANNRQLFALTDDPIGITEKIEKDIAGGKTQEEALKSIPLSMNRAVVGNLLGAFNFFSTNRDGLWLLPPTVEDNDDDSINPKRVSDWSLIRNEFDRSNTSREARERLIKRLVQEAL